MESLNLSRSEVEFLKEAMRSAIAEFDELTKTKEWFCTGVTEMLDAGLEILGAMDGETSTSNPGYSD